jgi:hypothetical protein
MLWFGSARFAEKIEHHGKRGFAVDAVRTENPRNRRVLIMKQAEQEVFGADPVAFQVTGLLDRPFKRLHGLAAKGDFGDKLVGGTDVRQRPLQVLDYGAALNAETIEHRESNAVTLSQHRPEKMLRIHRAVSASLRFFVRLSDDSARGLREPLKHDRTCALGLA